LKNCQFSQRKQGISIKYACFTFWDCWHMKIHHRRIHVDESFSGEQGAQKQGYLKDNFNIIHLSIILKSRIKCWIVTLNPLRWEEEHRFLFKSESLAIFLHKLAMQ
jgi:hypothetical protein